MALTKRADPAELKTIFLKVSIKESVLFLICVLQFLEMIFKQLSISLLKTSPEVPLLKTCERDLHFE